eukprot:677015-Prorocentrum_lima.AAC.1
MTSSLVGSEMCIRDSPNRTSRTSTGPLGRYWGYASVAMGRTKLAAGKPAVSYTHLTLPTICSV